MKYATCHPEKRHEARGLCGPCYKRERYQTDPEYRLRLLAKQKAAYENDPIKRLKAISRSKLRNESPQVRERRLAKMADYNRRSKYRLDQAAYEALIKKQNGDCAICRNPPKPDGKGRTFHVDHCHVRGVVRGLLCGPCNVGLGHFKDDPDILISAIKYLEQRND